jgi:hypothetical protein
MHVYVFSDGELLGMILVVALVAWFLSKAWTLRGVRKASRLQAHKAASTSEPIQEENRQLRALVDRQEGRIRTLEAIATDPAARTAREIESLRQS